MCPLHCGKSGLLATESMKKFSSDCIINSKILDTAVVVSGGGAAAVAIGFRPREEVCATGRAFGKLNGFTVWNEWWSDGCVCIVAIAVFTTY